MAQKRWTDENMVGTKFKNLTVIREIKKKHKNYNRFWQCVCDCGKELSRCQYKILNGTGHCGCKSPFRQKGNKNPNWNGCGELDGGYFSSLRGAAKRRGLEFTIDVVFAWELFLAQNRKCALTGIDLTFVTDTDRKRGAEATASIDRIDSSKGYTNSNIQWVHKMINVMKYTLSQEAFIEFCHMVASHHPK